MRHLIGVLTAATLLAGCTAYSSFDPLSTSGALLTTEGTVTVKAVFVPGGYAIPEPVHEAYRIAAVVPKHTSASVDHLKVSLFSVENGVEAPVTDPAGAPVVKAVSASEAESGVEISRLLIGRTYRLKATAYKTSDATESSRISAETVGEFTMEKGKVPAALQITLTDVPFSGEATIPSIEITPSGELHHEGPVVIDHQNLN